MHIILLFITGIVFTPDLNKLIFNDGTDEHQKLIVNKMTANEVIKKKATNDAKRNAKKWIAYPQFALFTSGGLATSTLFFGHEFLKMDDEAAFICSLILGSSGLVGSYNHFSKSDKKSIKAINPENNMLFNEIYYKEYNYRKFKNIIASTGLTAAAGTLFFLTTFSLGGDFYFGP